MFICLKIHSRPQDQEAAARPPLAYFACHILTATILKATPVGLKPFQSLLYQFDNYVLDKCYLTVIGEVLQNAICQQNKRTKEAVENRIQPGNKRMKAQDSKGEG
ncbi:platelet-derived growth factor receptor-like protein [Acipenser oxyrinchus oxyrinchus]|uniref:Platelet-derived growth factor receptor-like protein n=1 Tax=Acipenser oxyrinchus oxyrinchus TaxID=40147 RepID=A0AAD8GIK4_ACIOX|nr:platelet-derived growth factor receptor-like protein [Acipenser oxyrinchus oxyrinchus]